MRPVLALLTLVAMTGLAMADEASSVAAPTWQLQSIDGVEVSYEATIDLSEPGHVSGQAPCNRYGASLSGTLPEFRPGPVMATRMACERLDDESAFFALLSEMTTAEIGEELITLQGPAHSMVFARKTE